MVVMMMELSVSDLFGGGVHRQSFLDDAPVPGSAQGREWTWPPTYIKRGQSHEAEFPLLEAGAAK